MKRINKKRDFTMTDKIESQEEVKSTSMFNLIESIIDKHITDAKDYFDIVYRDKVIEAFKEYASQFKVKVQPQFEKFSLLKQTESVTSSDTIEDKSSMIWDKREKQGAEEIPLDLHNAWPTKDVLTKLIWATEHLLHEKNYDGHGHEELQICVKRGKEILEYVQSPDISVTDEEIKDWLKLMAIEYVKENGGGYEEVFSDLVFIGAKAMRDGKIKLAKQVK